MKKKETIKGKVPRVKPRSKPMPSKTHKSKRNRVKHKKNPLDETASYNVFM